MGVAENRVVFRRFRGMMDEATEKIAGVGGERGLFGGGRWERCFGACNGGTGLGTGKIAAAEVWLASIPWEGVRRLKGQRVERRRGRASNRPRGKRGEVRRRLRRRRGRGIGRVSPVGRGRIWGRWVRCQGLMHDTIIHGSERRGRLALDLHSTSI